MDGELWKGIQGTTHRVLTMVNEEVSFSTTDTSSSTEPTSGKDATGMSTSAYMASLTDAFADDLDQIRQVHYLLFLFIPPPLLLTSLALPSYSLYFSCLIPYRKRRWMLKALVFWWMLYPQVDSFIRRMSRISLSCRVIHLLNACMSLFSTLFPFIPPSL